MGNSRKRSRPKLVINRNLDLQRMLDAKKEAFRAAEQANKNPTGQLKAGLDRFDETLKTAFQEGMALAPHSAETANMNSLVPRVFEGVHFRSTADKEKCEAQVTGAYFKSIRELQREHRQERDEMSKSFDVQIQRLKDALELEQRRHFADITAFANGCHRYDGDPTTERRY